MKLKRWKLYVKPRPSPSSNCSARKRRNLKTDQVTKIVNEAIRKSRLANPGGVVRETQVYYLSGKVTTISTKAELEAYLLTTKTELLRLLQ
ncbi:hypothetical protein [Runella slithyformis]|uniref:Uncharacterized protein n=1 Tax=Runella slithyformis (strain ATCC 29530 / DSM 19594 / LMG 11500 / NCIMB 11436 / LSU 4) TaxID=761193 RepID=A0A7U4E996_RUNSL|nr:hypothetical protein [Runella slithyformis]AEI52183.1 hypothetical protein Runsl_5771 [Runella slithyformis DSM 19594]